MRRSTLSLLAAGAVACFMSWPAAAETFLPDFSTAQFDPAQPIDNPYFPMTDTRTYVYSGRDEDGPVDERFEHTNTGPGPVIAGVQTFIQQDLEFEDGLLVEKTFDYFAQDTMGNVWYLGEDVTKFEYDEDGNLIGDDHGGRLARRRQRRGARLHHAGGPDHRLQLLPGARGGGRGAGPGNDLRVHRNAYDSSSGRSRTSCRYSRRPSSSPTRGSSSTTRRASA